MAGLNPLPNPIRTGSEAPTTCLKSIVPQSTSDQRGQPRLLASHSIEDKDCLNRLQRRTVRSASAFPASARWRGRFTAQGTTPATTPSLNTAGGSWTRPAPPIRNDSPPAAPCPSPWHWSCPTKPASTHPKPSPNHDPLTPAVPNCLTLTGQIARARVEVALTQSAYFSAGDHKIGDGSPVKTSLRRSSAPSSFGMSPSSLRSRSGSLEGPKLIRVKICWA